jgi:polysaccharide biosynthesis/export protein
MRPVSLATALLLSLTAGAATPAQQTAAQPKGQTAPAQAMSSAQKTQAPQAATTDPAYVIGATDELNITVWEQPELSRTVPVRPDGMISLPLINDVQASGKTPMALAAVITQKEQQAGVKEPQVTVIVTAINSQRVYVSGWVARPGAYQLVPQMTVMQALTTAGGLQQFAKKTGIYVLRMENGKEVKYPFNYKQVAKGQNIGQDLVLKPGDMIVVP